MAFEMQYGLLSKDYTEDRIDLKDVKISCMVTSLTTNVHTTFIYFNQFDKSMDAKFVFPLLDVAVYAFEAHVENRVIIAECRPRMEAQTTYDEAVQSGHTAFLAQQDEHCEDIFQMSIGNVPSHATVTIVLKYVGQLCAVNVSDVESQAVFTLPSVINPRFTPPGTTIKSEYDPFATPSGVNSIPYAISFEASLCMPQDIVDVCSQRDTYSKEIDTADKKRAKVKLVSEFKFDHDLQMVIKMSQPLQSIVICESGDSAKPTGGFLSMDCLLAQFVPDFSQLASQQETRTELVFVVDRSGSMHGQRITSAAESLLLFLKALPVGCRFQIIGFGSHHEALFPQPDDYNERTLENALQYQQSMSANMGGTDVLPALREAFDAPLTGQGWYRQIIFLTDGEVTNADEVIGLVGANVHKARVFTIGIQTGASSQLIASVARVGHGVSAIVSDDTQLRGVVMKILGAALQPRAGEIKVCWNLKRSGKLVDVISVPTQIPPVYHKQAINAYGLIPAGNLNGLSGSVSLEYDILGQKLTTLLDVSTVQKMLSSVSADAPLHRLAGKCQLTELGDKYKTGLMNNKPKDDPEIKTLRDQIEKISCAINVISPVTSMVGVDPVKPDQPVSISSASNEQTGSVPIMKCCGAIPAAAFHGARSTCLMASSVGPMIADCHRSARRMCDSPDGLFGASRRDPVRSNSVAPPPPPPSCESVEPHPNDRWLSLVRLQSFVGSWDMDAQLANALGIPLSLLETSQPKTWPSPATTTSLQRPVWATALVISYFEHRLIDRKDEWELLAQKAHSWLLAQACSVQPDKAVAKQLCDRLLELAKKAIESNIV